MWLRIAQSFGCGFNQHVITVGYCEVITQVSKLVSSDMLANIVPLLVQWLLSLI